MDNDSILQFMSNMIARGNQDQGEGDYRDFLANYMNARNQGASDEDLQSMLSAFSPERIQAMKDFGGGPSFEKNPNIREARGSLNSLLRGY